MQAKQLIIGAYQTSTSEYGVIIYNSGYNGNGLNKNKKELLSNGSVFSL
jgi:hypothetical protein